MIADAVLTSKTASIQDINGEEARSGWIASASNVANLRPPQNRRRQTSP